MTTFSILISLINGLNSAATDALIQADAQAAAEMWANHILGVGNIQIKVDVKSSLSSSNELAAGGSTILNFETIQIISKSTLNRPRP